MTPEELKALDRRAAVECMGWELSQNGNWWEEEMKDAVPSRP